MSTHSNHGKYREPAIPGYIQGSLLNLLEFDRDMLSEYGLKLAEVFQQIKEEDEAKLRHEAEKLDSMFDK